MKPDIWTDLITVQYPPFPGQEQYTLALWRLKAHADAVLGPDAVRVHDMVAEDIDAWEEASLEDPPGILGFSCYVWNISQISKIAARIRKNRPEILLVVGGPAAEYFLPEKDRKPTHMDVVVLGEGEAVLVDIIRAFCTGGRSKLAKVPGLFLIDKDGSVHRTDHREPVSDLDSLASPYQTGLLRPKAEIILEGARGCPFNCTFCNMPAERQVGKQKKVVLRRFSPDYVSSDLKKSFDGGVRKVLMIEGTTNWNAARMRELYETLARVDPAGEMEFVIEIHPDILRPEHLDILRQMPGLLRLGIGLQSTDPEVLRAVRRTPHRKDLKQIIEDLEACGEVTADIMMGLPCDTPETFLRSVDHVIGLKIGFNVYRTVVAPGTELWRQSSKLGLRYDPETFVIQSTPTFSEKDLELMEEECIHRMNEESSKRIGGIRGEYGVCGRRIVKFEREKQEASIPTLSLTREGHSRLAKLFLLANQNPPHWVKVECGRIRISVKQDSVDVGLVLTPERKHKNAQVHTALFDLAMENQGHSDSLVEAIGTALRDIEQRSPEALAEFLRAMSPTFVLEVGSIKPSESRSLARSKAKNQILYLRDCGQVGNKLFADLARIAHSGEAKEIILEADGSRFSENDITSLAHAGVNVIVSPIESLETCQELHWISHFRKVDIQVWILMAVSSCNLDNLDAMIDAMIEIGPGSIAGIRFTSKPPSDSTAAPLEDICAAIASATHRAEAANLSIRIDGDIPLCLISGLEHLSEVFISDRKAIDTRARAKTCRQCRWSPWCKGPYAGYLDVPDPPRLVPVACPQPTKLDLSSADQNQVASYEVHVGFDCCYQCVFCPSAAPGHHRRRAKLEEVTGEIEHAARQGAGSINFSGGEPSLHPDFPEMVRCAWELGFNHIGMITNGRGLSKADKLDRLCELGLTRVSLSFHSHNARMEDSITSLRGSFAHKSQALSNLVTAHRAGQLPDGFSIKTVLQRKILGHLEKLVTFFMDRGVLDIGFNFIRPDHRACDKRWVPSLAETTPRLRELFLRNESSLGANLAFLDIPFCKLPWEVLSVPLFRQRYMGRNHDRQITIFLSESEGSRKRFDWKHERKNVMKSHVPACEQCLLRSRCEGIWRGYLNIYGSEEFNTGPSVVEACFAQRR